MRQAQPSADLGQNFKIRRPPHRSPSANVRVIVVTSPDVCVALIRFQRARTVIALRVMLLPGIGLNDIEHAFHPVVAATPGYTLLNYWFDSESRGAPLVSRTPIIAWRIDDGDIASPIVIDDDRGEDGLTSGILLPDGRVIMPCVETFADAAAWLAAMDRRAEESRRCQRINAARERLQLLTAPPFRRP